MADFHFNPSRLLKHTTHYASQGRGQFVLERLPKLLERHANGPILKSKELLLTGIVASQFTIPSLSLSTFEAFSYTGPTKKMAYGQAFQDFDVTFLLMGQTPAVAQSLYYTLAMWQKFIAGPTATKFRGVSIDEILGIPDNNNPLDQYKIQSDNDAFTVEYYDDYVTEAKMVVYSPTFQKPSLLQQVASGGDSNDDLKPTPIIEVGYTEVYPVTINPLQLSWENPDSPLTLSVTFAFHYADVKFKPTAIPMLD